jgi:hypothetical protein
MKEEKTFYLIAAGAAFLTAGTTFALWLLPRLYPPPANFAAGVELAGNGYYMARQWINLLHIPLALTAYFALAYKLRKKILPVAGLGFVWFIIWGITEMIGIAVIIFSVNRTWRAGFDAADEARKIILKSNIEAFYAIWDSMFFVLLIAFLLGTSFYGWATFRSKGVDRLLSYLFWLAAPLTILIILSGYAEISWADPLVAWIYPVLQPVSRFVLGLSLLKGEEQNPEPAGPSQ